jgi:hypothetical protein
MERRLQIALLYDKGARRARFRRIARLLARALVKRAADLLPIAESPEEWRAVLRSTRQEATCALDAHHTREDREAAGQRLWAYSAVPLAKQAFDDSATLEVVIRLFMQGAAHMDLLCRGGGAEGETFPDGPNGGGGRHSLTLGLSQRGQSLEEAAAAAAPRSAASVGGHSELSGTAKRKNENDDSGGGNDESGDGYEGVRFESRSSAMYDDPAHREAMAGLECALNIFWQLVTVAKARTWFIASGALEVLLSLLWAGGRGPRTTPAWFCRPSLALLATCARLPEGRRRILHPQGPSPHLLRPAVTPDPGPERGWGREDGERREERSLWASSSGSGVRGGCVDADDRDDVDVDASEEGPRGPRGSRGSRQDEEEDLKGATEREGDLWYLPPVAIWDVLMEAALWPVTAAPPPPLLPPLPIEDELTSGTISRRTSRGHGLARVPRGSRLSRSGASAPAPSRGSSGSSLSSNALDDTTYDGGELVEQPTVGALCRAANKQEHSTESVSV